MSPVVAPKAPGALGVAVQPQVMLAYLTALGEWVVARRAELDAVDQAVLRSPMARELTPDVALSMALWQAVKARQDQLLIAWDSGRVGPTELERLSSLIWGTLDAPGPASAALRGASASLPEACRLSDALIGQLRARLQLDPAAEQQSVRLRDLRAQIERLRDQARLEPPAEQPTVQAKVAALAARTEDLAAKRSRGGDIGGLLGPLEIEAATFERDLIVGGALRRQNRDKLERARSTRSDLQAREQALRTLVDHTSATVSPAPKYAVPDVEALGPVPNTAAALDEYLARLAKVGEAMRLVETANTEALRQREALSGLASALAAKAATLGVGSQPELVQLHDLIATLLAHEPTPIETTSTLISAYQTQLDWLTSQERS